MHKTKLLQLLKTFDSKELRAFGDFVSSPYFNKHEEITELYFYLKKQAKRDFPDKKIAKEIVFKELYPKQAFDEKRLNHLISQLLKLAEQYIGLQEWEQDGISSDYYTLRAYVHRQLDKNYQMVYRKAQKQLDDWPLRDAQFYFQQFLLAEAEEKRFVSKQKRQFDQSLQDASNALDRYFLAQKLKFLVGMLDRERQLSVSYQHHMMEAIKTYVAENDYQEIPPIAIYHTMLLTLTEGDQPHHFEKLKQLLEDFIGAFSNAETKELFYGAINYCINKIRSGENKYAAELMELYKYGLEQEVLLENGEISPWTFKNYVKLGLGLGRFSQVEQFVQEKYNQLPDQFREEARHFSLADLSYHQQQYDQALYHLNQIEFSDIHYLLGGKVMLLKIYFENEEIEPFLSLIQSFKIYLRRNQQLSQNIKLTYLNFVNIIYEINKRKASEKKSLQQKITTTRPLTDRTWLMQQLSN